MHIKPADALHVLFFAQLLAFAKRVYKVDVGSHEHQARLAAVAKIDLAKPRKYLKALKAGLLGNLARGCLFGGLTLFDMAFGDGPALFGS